MNWSEFWKGFLQKILTQLVSIKVWILAASFIFVGLELITVAAFTAIVSLILGIKGAYYIADVVKDKAKDIIERI